MGVLKSNIQTLKAVLGVVEKEVCSPPMPTTGLWNFGKTVFQKNTIQPYQGRRPAKAALTLYKPPQGDESEAGNVVVQLLLQLQSYEKGNENNYITQQKYVKEQMINQLRNQVRTLTPAQLMRIQKDPNLQNALELFTKKKTDPVGLNEGRSQPAFSTQNLLQTQRITLTALFNREREKRAETVRSFVVEGDRKQAVYPQTLRLQRGFSTSFDQRVFAWNFHSSLQEKLLQSSASSTVSFLRQVQKRQAQTIVQLERQFYFSQKLQVQSEPVKMPTEKAVTSKSEPILPVVTHATVGKRFFYTSRTGTNASADENTDASALVVSPRGLQGVSQRLFFKDTLQQDLQTRIQQNLAKVNLGNTRFYSTRIMRSSIQQITEQTHFERVAEKLLFNYTTAKDSIFTTISQATQAFSDTIKKHTKQTTIQNYKKMYLSSNKWNSRQLTRVSNVDHSRVPTTSQYTQENTVGNQAASNGGLMARILSRFQSQLQVNAFWKMLSVSKKEGADQERSHFNAVKIVYKQEPLSPLPSLPSLPLQKETVNEQQSPPVSERVFNSQQSKLLQNRTEASYLQQIEADHAGKTLFNQKAIDPLPRTAAQPIILQNQQRSTFHNVYHNPITALYASEQNWLFSLIKQYMQYRGQLQLRQNRWVQKQGNKVEWHTALSLTKRVYLTYFDRNASSTNTVEPQKKAAGKQSVTRPNAEGTPLEQGTAVQKESSFAQIAQKTIPQVRPLFNIILQRDFLATVGQQKWSRQTTRIHSHTAMFGKEIMPPTQQNAFHTTLFGKKALSQRQLMQTSIPVDGFDNVAATSYVDNPIENAQYFSLTNRLIFEKTRVEEVSTKEGLYPARLQQNKQNQGVPSRSVLGKQIRMLPKEWTGSLRLLTQAAMTSLLIKPVFVLLDARLDFQEEAPFQTRAEQLERREHFSFTKTQSMRSGRSIGSRLLLQKQQQTILKQELVAQKPIQEKISRLMSQSLAFTERYFQRFEKKRTFWKEQSTEKILQKETVPSAQVGLIPNFPEATQDTMVYRSERIFKTDEPLQGEERSAYNPSGAFPYVLKQSARLDVQELVRIVKEQEVQNPFEDEEDTAGSELLEHQLEQTAAPVENTSAMQMNDSTLEDRVSALVSAYFESGDLNQVTDRLYRSIEKRLKTDRRRIGLG